jgi:hypothetical protein
MTEDKVRDGEATIANSGEHERVRTRWSETSSGEASVIEACAIGDGIAINNVHMEVAMSTTSGGAGTLPTPILGMTAIGPSARVRPRVTNSGG